MSQHGARPGAQSAHLPAVQPAAQPNILIIIPDELRHDSLGYAGHPVYRTPHIDRIAREGVWFSRAYCTGPLCMPARASMISGTYPHNHSIQDNAGHLPAEDESYARLLQRAGYHTAYVGKTHFGSDAPGRDFVEHETYVQRRGFDYVHQIPGPAALTKTDNHLTRRWQQLGLLEPYREDYRRRSQDPGSGAWASPLPVEEFADVYVGQHALAWLRDYDRPQPFLLVTGFGGPHPPFDAPEPYASMYSPDSMPDPIAAESEPGEWLPDHARARLPAFQRQGHGREHSAEVACRVSKERMANYGGKISLIDDQVGQLLDLLDARGLTENTLVIFLSDHGEMGGDHGRYHKSVFFESSVRIPFALRWPARSCGPNSRPVRPELVEGQPHTGRRVDALIEQLDLFATLLDAAGVPPSERSFARSLLPLATNSPDAQPRDAVYSELKREIMLRTERHKYAVDNHGRSFMLYDLADDPTEQRNLVGHPDATVIERDLRERLLTWLVSTQIIRRD